MRGPQLNIRGLSVEEIEEFDAARKGIGPEGSNLSRKIFLKMILRRWKEATAPQSSKGVQVREVEGFAKPPKSVGRGVRGARSA